MRGGRLLLGFENHRELGHDRVVDQSREERDAELTLPDVGVTILVRVEAELRTVHMNRLDLGQADRLIQLAHHAVVVVHQIVAGIQHMAGVERDADLRLILHAIHDRGELIEIAATFRAFAGHGLQKHHDAGRALEHLIQSLADQPAAGLGALAHMRAGMNIDIHLLSGLADGGQQLDVLGQRLDRECALGLILAG